MQIQKVIEQLGFSAKEAKVYLAALHLGEAHISDIADNVKMPRSSVQTIVDKLYKEGLMNFYVLRRYKYWIAEDPGKLLNNLHKREEEMRKVLPELEAIKKAGWNKSNKTKNKNTLIGIFRELADGSEQPILITDENAQIEYVNEAWEKQFGYKMKEVYQENPRILQSGKTPKKVHEQMWKSLKLGKMFQSDEIIDKRKDGTIFSLMTTIFPLKHQGCLYYIQILDDITERKRVETMRKKFSQASQP